MSGPVAFDLEKFVAEYGGDDASGTPVTPNNGFDLVEWLERHSGQLPPWRGKASTQYRHMAVFEVCPFNESHTGGRAHVHQEPGGKLGGGCKHKSCGWGWRELRELVEPNRATGPVALAVDRAPRAEPTPIPWPILNDKAEYGLFGDVVSAIDPHTEADRAAILYQLLTAFGNVIGRSAFYRVEADKHHGNLLCVLAGTSAKGRKGTSWGHVRQLFAHVAEGWKKTRVVSGLSSGEGLKYAVRDPRTEKQAIKEKRKVIDYQMVEVDAGVTDKRLLVVESEFGGTLRVAAREKNTLSATIRDAFDTGDLRSMTKNDPTVATGAHISIIGHVTTQELLKELTSTDACNGFANRFLWVCCKRSKLLPHGGNYQGLQKALIPLQKRLCEVVEFATGTEQLRRDDAANALWAKVYPELSAERPGLFGSVTARSEALTVRLSLLYALADKSKVIGVNHLLAALAAWKYCDDSAKYIFGTLTGNSTADRIEAELQAQPDGLTRTELTSLFANNYPAAKLTEALELLHNAGRVEQEREATGGRPAERWRATGTKKTKETK